MNSLNRRHFLASSTLGGACVAVSPLTALAAWARSGEDPVAVIEGFANELFALFEPLNGRSDSHASRRAALRAVVDRRFAYDRMIETAVSVATSDFSSTEWTRLHHLGRDLAVEFLLSFFVQYSSQNSFRAEGVRESRSGNRTMLDTVLVSKSGQDVPIRWDLVQRDNRCMVFDVRVFGISLINDVAGQVDNAYSDGGKAQIFKVLDRRVANFKRRFPD